MVPAVDDVTRTVLILLIGLNARFIRFVPRRTRRQALTGGPNGGRPADRCRTEAQLYCSCGPVRRVGARLDVGLYNYSLFYWRIIDTHRSKLVHHAAIVWPIASSCCTWAFAWLVNIELTNTCDASFAVNKGRALVKKIAFCRQILIAYQDSLRHVELDNISLRLLRILFWQPTPQCHACCFRIAQQDVLSDWCHINLAQMQRDIYYTIIFKLVNRINVAWPSLKLCHHKPLNWTTRIAAKYWDCFFYVK